jgi:hypothetical protein
MASAYFSYSKLLQAVLFFQGVSFAHCDKVAKVVIDWEHVTAISKTVATLQVVANPVLNTKTSPVAPKLFQNLRDLQADLVRYVPWFPYPLVGVAELEPPNADTRTTSWNFTSELQQQFLDTFHAVTDPPLPSSSSSDSTSSAKKRVVINFSTQPTWMFNTTDWSYNNKDPDKANWNYPRGRWINTTTKLVADYYGRLASWIIKGNFLDEFGTLIEGGPALGDKITHWEIFNEPDGEHGLTPEQYNTLFDAVVRAIRNDADPDHRIQFVGLAMEGHNQWDFWKTFLTKENHEPDTQDAVVSGMASFHWYGSPSSRTNVSTFVKPFEQIYIFLNEVDKIIAMRDDLSPTTALAVNEAGVIPPDDNKIGVEDSPPIYYNMAAAVFTVLVSELSVKGIDLVGSSQFCGCPEIPLWDISDRQFPGVSMTNWTTGSGNPRYWALKLYLQYFGPGDKIVASSPVGPSDDKIFLQARITKYHNKYVIIVVNKTDQQQTVKLKHLIGARVSIVDETTHDQPWKEYTSNSRSLNLEPFAVAVVDTAIS